MCIYVANFFFFNETEPHFEDRLCNCLIRSGSERLQMTAGVERENPKKLESGLRGVSGSLRQPRVRIPGFKDAKLSHRCVTADSGVPDFFN